MPRLFPFSNSHVRVAELSVIPNLYIQKSSHTYFVSLHSQVASSYIHRCDGTEWNKYKQGVGSGLYNSCNDLNA